MSKNFMVSIVDDDSSVREALKDLIRAMGFSVATFACAEDFLGWQPLSYAEHFTASNFKARDLAIEAYNAADARIRSEFDGITGAMTSILAAVSAAMREATQDKIRARLAEQATGWVKPLVMQAGSIINGDGEADVDYIMTH